jgi:hypothetical protein
VGYFDSDTPQKLTCSVNVWHGIGGVDNMAEARILNTIGLALVIAGCVLLYCFGLPPSVEPSGHSYLLLEKTDDKEIAKGKRYRALGHIGISLVALGSLFQICATWVA